MRRSSDSPPLNPVDKMLTRVKEMAGIKTDKELAKKLGIPASNVSGWRIRGSIPTENIRKIADTLGIPYGILMDEPITNPEELVTRIIGDVPGIRNMLEMTENFVNESITRLESLQRDLMALNRHLIEQKMLKQKESTEQTLL